MLRTHQPEWLDSLPPHHPDALHNRRDLRLTNRLMGNNGWFRRTLPPLLHPGVAVLELGAGTGELASSLNAAGARVDGLDLWPQPGNWPANRTWHTGDLRTFAHYGRYSAVIGNLIFHQFNDGELMALGETLRDTAHLIVACEPARRRTSQFLYRTLGPLFGANHVSLHDAHVSIAAGFCGEELPHALGLKADLWEWHCATTVLGAYRMVARRRA
jgi:hypothetical protein